MNPAPPKRGKARSFIFALAVVTLAGWAPACAFQARSNGESCLKDQDCLSELCVASECRAAPTLLDAEASGDGTIAADSGGSVDASGDVATMETSTTKDSGSMAVDSGSALETSTADSGSGDSGSE